MDDIQKSRVRLAHWIEHNVDHLKGYQEVAKVMEEHGLTDVAEMIRSGILAVEKANEEFGKALAKLGPEKGDPHGDTSSHSTHDDDAHHHHHGHTHGHRHTHEHDHDH